MKIEFNKTDALNATLHLTIEPTDFLPEYEKQIKQINKTAKFPGFRPGHVPKSMIEKRFGDQLLVESVLNMANEQVNQYVRDEKLDILGYPLSSDKQAQIDTFTKDRSYEFVFDLGLTPQIELKLENLPSFEKMVLKPTDQMIDEEIGHILRQLGSTEETDGPAADADSVTVKLAELNENGEPLEGGLNTTTRVLISVLKDEPTKQLFVGASKGESFKVNVFNLFNNDHNEMQHALNIPHDAVHDLGQSFLTTIESVTKVVAAESNEETWNRAFGPETCKSEDDFRTEVAKMLTNMYEGNTQHILEHDVTDSLLETHQIELPDEFMKRWLMQAHNKEYNAENIESRYGLERKGLQWQLIREKIEEQFDLKLEQEDLEQAAFHRIYDLFRQVGLNNAPYEQIQSFAADRLKDEKFVKEIAPGAMQQKVIKAVLSKLNIQTVELAHEELVARIQTHNAKHHAHDHEHSHDHAHDHEHEHQH